MYTFSLYERLGSPFWWVKCYVQGEGGKPRRWSSGVHVEHEAGRRQSRRLAAKRAEEQASRLSTRPATTTDEAALHEVAKRLLRQKEADGRRPRAVDALAHVLEKHVLPYFGANRDVRTIRRSDLEGFKIHVKAIGKAPVTVNNCLTAIRQCLKHAANVDEILETVPHVANVRVSHEGKGRALTAEEVTALIEAVDPRAVEARQFLAFLANTGLRKTETLAMRWGWIDFELHTVTVPGEHRKGGRSRVFPLNAAAQAILEQRRAHGTKYTGSVKRPLPTGPGDRVWLQVKHDEAKKTAAKKAGLGRVRNHDLRYTFGSLAWEAGASLPEVRDLLGHSTLAMVNRYAQSYQERLHEAAGRVSIVPGSVPSDGSKRAGLGREWNGRRKRSVGKQRK